MGENTENHGFYIPDIRETGWDTEKNSDWELIDTLLADVDDHANVTEDETVTGSWSFDQTVGADVSGDADTVDGNHASDFADANHDHDADYAAAGHDHDDDYAAAGHGHAHSDLSGVSSDDHHTKTQPSDINSSNWDDYEIQKDGTDGAGIINFKTE